LGEYFNRNHHVSTFPTKDKQDERSGRWFSAVPWILDLSKEQRATWSVRQKCIHGYFVPKEGATAEDNVKLAPTASVKERQVNKVGIKHFPTNRVYLKGQVQFFDKSPCLLIVPAMEYQEVVKWNGEGYSAIVLAGGQMGSSKTNAEKVYEDVGACKGGYEGEFLATKTDVSMARLLLEKVLRCLAKSPFQRQPVCRRGKGRFKTLDG
jgi:hypothetical protein